MATKKANEIMAPEISQILCGRDIVLLASAPWRIDGKVNCHQLAFRLMQDNRVLFVESSGLRRPKLTHKSDRLKILRRIVSWVCQLFRGKQGNSSALTVLSPLVWPNPARESLNGRLLAWQVNRAIQQLGFRDPILWMFLPTAAAAVGHIASSCRIYHCVDDYAGNPGVDACLISTAEAKLLDVCDLVFTTSMPLESRLAAVHPHVIRISNGAEVRRFFDAREIPNDLLTIQQPRIAYVGNLAGYMIDIPLLYAVASRHPQWSFIMIGPEGVGDPRTDLARLRQLPNIHMIGPRPYGDIPNYLAGVDVCLIPFVRNRVTESALPLKTCEYLATGKPVVATPLQALREETALADIISFADTPETFADAIATALQSSAPADEARRREVALKYDWSHIYDVICREVASVSPIPNNGFTASDPP